MEWAILVNFYGILSTSENGFPNKFHNYTYKTMPAFDMKLLRYLVCDWPVRYFECRMFNIFHAKSN